MSVNKYPLSWPEGWRRTERGDRKRAAFNRKEHSADSYPRSKELSIYDGVTRVTEELRRMGVVGDDLIISTNVPTRLDGMPRSDRADPTDSGAAVYWQLPGEPMLCLAIDRYDRVADNLAADRGHAGSHARD